MGLSKRTFVIAFIILTLLILSLAGVNDYILNDSIEFNIQYTGEPINSDEMGSGFDYFVSTNPLITINGKMTKSVDNYSRENNFLFHNYSYSFVGYVSIDEINYNFDNLKPLIFTEFIDGKEEYLFASTSVSPEYIIYENLVYENFISVFLTSEFNIKSVQLVVLDTNSKLVKQFDYLLE